MEDVPTHLAIKTPQFLLLGTSFFCLATGGMAMFSVAKSMMTEVFAGVQPSLAAFSSVRPFFFFFPLLPVLPACPCH